MKIRDSILELLSDGRPHKLKEIHTHCDSCSIESIRVHINILRKKLRPNGEDIVAISFGHHSGYQWVRLIGPGE